MPPHKRSQVRGPAVRDELVMAADELFTAKGAGNVGVDEIAATSGIAKSTLYRWFPTKDDLVVAYLRRRDAAFWQVWDTIAADHAGRPADELIAQLEWIRDYIAMPEFRGCPFLNITAEFADAGHRARTAAQINKVELRRRLTTLAEQLGITDPPALADQLVLVVDGAFATSQVFGADGPQNHLVEAGRALISVHLGATQNG
ncbi:TetR/AcrR family transcriptional regulator [Actinomadura barringtoniae]|uniref:TetR/AcrR family transcriptional regulator n=1 Tax=Actinomadura barringtoniae TaxID=1427535 RepID=A0A939PIQ9_9ACTN|nr:TetR/AcrR family transcriptional regulator [Actinomadura barringtoniae]MBO2453170.1 TetR/AcrR family transcriptional regulator [Actinomadura barringtoniae]